MSKSPSSPKTDVQTEQMTLIQNKQTALEQRMPSKTLEYIVRNQIQYHGEGHIINIAKRHTNRRWRQYTPQKQVNIELQLTKLSIVQSIELKGFGTYIVQISFKDANNQLVTKIKYNFDFFDQSIKQDIVCEQQIKFVDVKLINNEQNPKRMGINHFFMRGQTIKVDGQQSDQEEKKKKKRGAPNQIWVRQKVEGQQDPWGLDDVQNQSAGQGKANQKATNQNKRRPKRKVQSKVQTQSKLSPQLKINTTKRQQPLIPFENNSLHPVTQMGQSEIQDISKSKKKSKSGQPQQIKLQLQRTSGLNRKQVYNQKQLFSQKFEQKFKIKQQISSKQNQIQQSKIDGTKRQSEKQHPVSVNQETQEQKKIRVKQQLIRKLRAKIKQA